MSSLLIRGGRVVDPAHPGSGAVRDLVVRDGRIADAVPASAMPRRSTPPAAP